jgi:hypothetical protein
MMECFMQPRWITLTARFHPNHNNEVNLLIRDRRPDPMIEYAKGKFVNGEWVYTTETHYDCLWAWLESDRVLTEEEVCKVPKPPVF